MANVTLSTDQQASAIVRAAHSAGIPVSVLVGVYGLETSFGSHVASSSAGAVGPFQFLPSTARQWSYPLTNTPTAAQFQQQANAAANYLGQLYHSHQGNWDAALKAYSGGGYGVQNVASSAVHGPLDFLDAIVAAGVSQHTGDTSITGGTPITKGVQEASNTASQASAGVGQIAALLTSQDFWIRLAEGILGAALLLLALRELTGGSGNPATVAKSVVAHVR